jgi:hypothetical protein
MPPLRGLFLLRRAHATPLLGRRVRHAIRPLVRPAAGKSQLELIFQHSVCRLLGSHDPQHAQLVGEVARKIRGTHGEIINPRLVKKRQHGSGPDHNAIRSKVYLERQRP